MQPWENDKAVFVYFISAYGQHDMQRIKIGRSNDPYKRLRKLQTGSPVKLKMLGAVRCRSAEHSKQVERLAHNIFHKQRRRGEWFRLSQKHVEQVRSLVAKAAAAQKLTYSRTSGVLRTQRPEGRGGNYNQEMKRCTEPR